MDEIIDKLGKISFQNNLDFGELYNLPTIIAHHQKIFSKYKGIYKRKNVILLATGPTLNYFPKIRGIYVGVNHAITSKFPLDYYFVTDYNAIRDIPENVIMKSKSKKFFGIVSCAHLKPDSDIRLSMIPPMHLMESKNAEYFYCSSSYRHNFCLDPSIQPLYPYGSVVFSALSFILYTRPKRLYLVGCDCSGLHFNNNKENDFSLLRIFWPLYVKYIKTFFPKLKIISVNPIGLKGMFRDVYTQSFLDDHPEIDQSNVEIIDTL